MDYLSQNISHLSSLPGYSEKEAEHATGIGQSAINKIANGRTKEAGYRTVSKLARFYGVSIDDLVNRDLSAAEPAGASHPVGLDSIKLADLIETVEAAIARSGVSIPSRTKARILAALYGDDQASAASSASAVQAAIAGILASMEEAKT